MIDFANLKYLEIPEGEVVEVRRGDELLWKKPSDILYTELAYIESTGTQYIKTDISLTQDSSFEMAITPLKVPSQPSAFFGARGGNASTQHIGIAFGTDRSVAVDFNNSNYNNFRALTYASLNQEYIFSGNKNERKIINASGSVVASNTRICNDTINTDVVSIFTQSGVASTCTYATARLRYLKIWNNDELVHDIIPVLDFENVPCLYDKVTEQFFYNEGTGQFKYATIEDEYREVGYIESTGTEWIDTGYNINTSTDSVYLEFEALDTTVYKWLFGEHDNNARFGIGTGDGTDKRNVAYGNNTYKVKDSQIYNGKHIFQADNTGVYLNGTKVANYSSFQSTSSLYLFNLNLSGGTYQTKARVWKYQHYRDGELIRDMYPVLSKSINRAGLFDKVSMRFFGNNGAGEFQYSGLPIEYEPVEFLESTGTQWIDTGITFKNTDECYAEAQMLQTQSDKFFVAPKTWNNNTNRFSLGGFYVSKYICAYGSVGTPSSIYVPEIPNQLMDKHRFSYKDKIFTIEDTGSTYDATSARWGGDTTELRLFWGYNAPTKCRIYAYQQKRDGMLIRNFIPCYRKEDGEAGLYDTVTKAFFTNNGTGDFVYPTDIEVAQLMRANSLDEDMIEALAGVPTAINYKYDDNVVE